jgi:biopolymer transport protein TolR
MAGGIQASDSGMNADINMTPMVDVMLVLLVIFMLITPALMAGFTAQLPKGKNLIEREDDDKRTTLGIDRDGNMYLNKKPIPQCKPSTAAGCRESVINLLTGEMQKHPTDAVLFIKADQKLAWREMAESMRWARVAGFAVAAMVSETLGDEEEQ